VCTKCAMPRQPFSVPCKHSRECPGNQQPKSMPWQLTFNVASACTTVAAYMHAGGVDSGLAPTQPCVLCPRAQQAAPAYPAAVLHLCRKQVDGQRPPSVQHDAAVPKPRGVCHLYQRFT
jgi:hypothetical protein